MLHGLRDWLWACLHRPTNPVIQVLLGSYTIVWGLWVGSPFWSVFSRAPIYSEMHRFAPEWAFGIMAVLAGGMVLRGAWRTSYQALSTGAIVGAMHWITISVLYFSGDWRNTGGVTSLFIGLMMTYLYLNVAINHYSRTEGDGD